MAKRRNKNKAPGPVKLIKPVTQAEPTPPSVDEVPAAAEDAVEAAVEAAPLETATSEIPILEMDMQSARGPEQDYLSAAVPVPEVDDASGALAQAIEVDPNTITAKAKQFESIPIVDAESVTIDLAEQGVGDATLGVAGERAANAGRENVTFDLPESSDADPVVADAVDGKGKKSNRKLKLSKLQKHARSAPAIEPQPEPVVEAPAPKPMREPRTSAFAKLIDYQVLSLAHVPGLPEEADVPGHWRGVGFGLGGRRLVSAFDEVVEIMRMPQITHVPGTQPWMLGVANVRGTLLPVVDLKQFLEGERTVMHEGQRVLVVRQGGGNVAVLIDQLFGQRSFNDSQKTILDEDESRYGHFVKQMYRVGDYDWGVFSMSMLTRTPEFRQAAA